MSLRPIVMYTSRFCPFCSSARQFVMSKGWDFEEISVDGDPCKRAEMVEKSGRQTVPQIWIGSTHVGGCDELMAIERSGQLDALVIGAINE